ncbi:hypothetical protein OG474_24495 [Kribbella sp. NBC_01505]|uniref:hypothetical protein n=1 Tax=Kribbella sp. NBC_01505 TaxID=2903580 RepID=UPI003863B847
MSEWVTDPETGFALGLPNGWEQLQYDGLSLAIAIPVPDGYPYRPNITVLIAEIGSEVDIRKLGTDAIVAAKLTSDDPHVLAYDLHLAPDGVVGRRLTFAYRSDANAIAVTQWLLLHQGLYMVITASCLISDLTTVQQAFEYSVDVLRLPGAEVSA